MVAAEISRVCRFMVLAGPWLDGAGWSGSGSLNLVRAPGQRASPSGASRAELYFNQRAFLKLFFRFICKYLKVEEGICRAD
jgi:hypothetical protein